MKSSASNTTLAVILLWKYMWSALETITQNMYITKREENIAFVIERHWINWLLTFQNCWWNALLINSSKVIANHVSATKLENSIYALTSIVMTTKSLVSSLITLTLYYINTINTFIFYWQLFNSHCFTNWRSNFHVYFRTVKSVNTEVPKCD